MSLMLPPIVNVIVGWGTTYLAIRMLFRPREPWFFFGWRVPMTPGIFVARREEFARRLAASLVDHLGSRKDVAMALAQAVDRGFVDKMLSVLPLASRVVVSSYLGGLKPADIDNFCKHLSSTLSSTDLVEVVVVDKISSLEPGEIENMILDVVEKEFSSLAVLGGVLGFVAGSVQSLVMAL